MLDFLHSFFVLGIKWFMEFFLSVSVKSGVSPFLAVVGLSVVVNLLLSPVQRSISSIQGRVWALSDRVRERSAHIRRTFSGAERQMVLSAYYREVGYSPISSALLALPTLVQIPFFIAAYEAVTRSEMFHDESFLGLFDFGSPDGLLAVGSFSVNVLPLVMTALSLVAAWLVMRGRRLSESWVSFVLPLVFLVLLYGAPSGMVLYWTVSQVVSLVRALVSGRDVSRAKHVVLLGVLTLGVGYGIFAAVGQSGVVDALSAFFCSACLSAVPAFLLWSDGEWEAPGVREVAAFVAVSLAFGIMSCCVFPTTVVYGNMADFSVSEFEYGPSLLSTYVVTAGLFGCVVPVLFCFCLPATRVRLRRLFLVLLVVALPSAFVLGDYRSDATYVFNTFIRQPQTFDATSLSLLLVVVAFVAIWHMPRRFDRVADFVCVSVIAAGVVYCAFCMPPIMSMYDTYESRDEYRVVPSSGEPRDVLKLSSTERNVVVVFLDCSSEATAESIFECLPELRDTYDGFTFYRNALSSGEHTVFGSMPIYGGYDYWFDSVQAADDVSLSEKLSSAHTLMARLFSEAGGTVSYVSPTLSSANGGFTWGDDLEVFDGMPNVEAYTKSNLYQNLGDDMYGFPYSICLEHHLLMCGVVKAAPAFMKEFFYSGAGYGDTENPYAFSATYVDEHGFIDKLDELTSVGDRPGHLSVIHSLVTHDLAPVDCETWDFATSWDLSSLSGLGLGGEEYFSENGDFPAYYADSISFFKRFGRWLDHLREEGVYDNTRIIVVSDHGRLNCRFGRQLGDTDRYLDALNPTLMVKDFDAHGFSMSSELMTNGDTPALALAGIVENPVNPATGNPVDMSHKKSPFDVTISDSYDVLEHGENTFNVTDDEVVTFFGKSGDDIVDLDCWSSIPESEGAE